MAIPVIDPQQFHADFEALAAIGRLENGAMHRVAYSDADRQGRKWLKRQFDELNIPTEDDPAGNTIAHYAGQADLPPIAIGSHTDSVPEGGIYDGALGTIAALSVIRALYHADIQLQHPVTLINFAAEEATMAGGTTGSQAMTGIFNPTIVDRRAWDGQPVRYHLQKAGLNPERITEAKRSKGAFAAFVELHIEQATQLESKQTNIGIVEGFVGIRRYAVIFTGQANHAGTTPMNKRDDALLKAIPYVQFVRQMALDHEIVGTVGDFSVYPGAPNVIPGRVEMVVEIRGLDEVVLDQTEQHLQAKAETLDATFEVIIRKPPVKSDDKIMQAIVNASERLELSHLTLTSGAGHDAMVMATLCPQAMLFVPSKYGISHSSDEYTSPEDCLNGARVLLETVIILDRMLTS